MRPRHGSCGRRHGGGVEADLSAAAPDVADEAPSERAATMSPANMNCRPWNSWPNRRAEPPFDLSEEFLEQNSAILQQTWRDFGVRGEIIDANPARW